MRFSVGPICRLRKIGASWLICMILLTIVPWSLCGCKDDDASKTSAKPEDAREVAQALQQARRELDATVWKEEVLAQEYEAPFIKLWDDLREARDKYAVIAKFPFEELIVHKATATTSHDWGIQVTRYAGAADTLQHGTALSRLEEYRKQGYEIVETEWHHAAFDLDEEGTANSTVSFLVHATHAATSQRIVLKGKLQVRWKARSNATDELRPSTLELTDLLVYRREGPPAFQEVMALGPNPRSPKPNEVEPILVYDLDRDGRCDIILAGANLVQRNQGRGRFITEPLCREVVSRVDAAVIADFTGDAIPDLLIAGGKSFLHMYQGDREGRFSSPQVVGAVTSRLVSPIAITAGDIDGDGDLDAWVAQYKVPYVGGQMPTPYYDANDGFPSYLLINDGHGNFTDGTVAAGLDKKRRRRTYSSSFVDLDDDGDLDLIVVSDFAGFDLHYNDGRGRFTDRTELVVGTGQNNFGMSHTFSDFNRDGLMDFLVVGMSSTTARRLDQMNLGRAEFQKIKSMRQVMGYGNRLYLGNREQYTLASFNDSLARTGWSWGCTSSDFDNDGDVDIYIGNGHSSGESCKDYCTRFWTHDIYTENSKTDSARAILFKNSLLPVNSGRESWNGYEHNALFMNEKGQDFINVGFLAGVSFEYDSRAVVGVDLDNDGSTDLVTVERSVRPKQRDTLHVYRNQWSSSNHWIGVRVDQSAPDYNPVGATVTVRTASHTMTEHLMTGDSYRTQHPNVKLFGLGKSDRVEKIELRWPNGKVTRILNPAVDRYHTIGLPQQALAPTRD